MSNTYSAYIVFLARKTR